MHFIDLFMGYGAVWLLIGLCVADIAILAAFLWLMWQEWKDRHGR